MPPDNLMTIVAADSCPYHTQSSWRGLVTAQG